MNILTQTRELGEIYRSRDSEIRASFSVAKIIDSIRNAYNSEYDPSLAIDAWDQFLICEAVAESTPILQDYRTEQEENDTNVSVNGSVNGSYKRTESTIETQLKLQVILELKACNYRTPPKTISKLLEQLFSLNKSKEGHWLWIAQRYTPKSINSVIAKIQNLHTTGADTILNPSAYFTKLIKYHPKRKKFRANNCKEIQLCSH